MNYETRRDMIVTHAWEIWTNNGLGMDKDDRDQATSAVQDAVNNAYVGFISDQEWLAAALRCLKQETGIMTMNTIEEQTVSEQLEAMIDRHGLLHIVTALELICDDKAGHIAVNWQNARSAKPWASASAALWTAARTIDALGI